MTVAVVQLLRPLHLLVAALRFGVVKRADKRRRLVRRRVTVERPFEVVPHMRPALRLGHFGAVLG